MTAIEQVHRFFANEGLSEKEAVRLLNSVTGINNDNEQALSLALLLEKEAFWLSLAAHHISRERAFAREERAQNYGSYQAQLQKSLALLTAEEQVKSQQLSLAVSHYAALQMSLCALSEASKELLDVCSLLPATAVPRVLLRCYTGSFLGQDSRSSFLNDQPLCELLDRGLLVPENSESTSFVIHPAVHSSVWLDFQQRLSSSSSFSSPSNWPPISVAHNLLCLLQYPSYQGSDQKHIHFQRQMQPAMIFAVQKLLQLLEVGALPPSLHHLFIFGLNVVGSAALRLGDIAEGRELLEHCLRLFEHGVGQHSDVGSTMSNLAYAHAILGDMLTRKELLERALPFFEENHGRDHPNTATVLYDLSCAHSALGDSDQQQKLLLLALDIKERHLGNDHPDLAPILYHLGKLAVKQGDDERSAELLQRALSLFDKHVDPNHVIKVADTLLELARLCTDVGEKKELLERALPIMPEKGHNQDHLELALSILTDLTDLHQQLGDLQPQKELLQRTLAIQQELHGPNDAKLIPTLLALSNVLARLGDANQSKEQLKRALHIGQQHHGPYHHELADILGNLALAHGNLGDMPMQKQLLEQALEIQEKHFGRDHPQMGIPLANLALTCGALGDRQRQKELLERALPLVEAQYGRYHPHVALCLKNLALVGGELGDLQGKKELLEWALDIEERLYGKVHPNLAETLEQLGNTLGKLGDPQRQAKLLERALPLYESILDKHHPHLGNLLGTLSNAHGHLGDFTRQKELLERALIILQHCYGTVHSEVATALFNLGNALGKLGDVSQQTQLLEKASHIFEQCYGKDHSRVAQVLLHLANAHGKLGNASLRRELLLRALPTLEAQLGRQHPLVADIIAESQPRPAPGDSQGPPWSRAYSTMTTRQFAAVGSFRPPFPHFRLTQCRTLQSSLPDSQGSAISRLRFNVQSQQQEKEQKPRETVQQETYCAAHRAIATATRSNQAALTMFFDHPPILPPTRTFSTSSFRIIATSSRTRILGSLWAAAICALNVKQE